MGAGAVVATVTTVGTAGANVPLVPAEVSGGGLLGGTLGYAIGHTVDHKDEIGPAAKGAWNRIRRAGRKALEVIAIAVGLRTGDQLPPRPDPDKDRPPPPAPSSRTMAPSDRKDRHVDPLQQQ